MQKHKIANYLSLYLVIKSLSALPCIIYQKPQCLISKFQSTRSACTLGCSLSICIMYWKYISNTIFESCMKYYKSVDFVNIRLYFISQSLECHPILDFSAVQIQSEIFFMFTMWLCGNFNMWLSVLRYFW